MVMFVILNYYVYVVMESFVFSLFLEYIIRSWSHLELDDRIRNRIEEKEEDLLISRLLDME